MYNLNINYIATIISCFIICQNNWWFVCYWKTWVCLFVFSKVTPPTQCFFTRVSVASGGLKHVITVWNVKYCIMCQTAQYAISSTLHPKHVMSLQSLSKTSIICSMTMDLVLAMMYFWSSRLQAGKECHGLCPSPLCCCVVLCLLVTLKGLMLC